MPPAERRRNPRMGLSVIVRVQGHDPDGPAWEEMRATDDGSYGGASFPLKHPQRIFASGPFEEQTVSEAGFDRVIHAVGVPPLPGEAP